mgnify:CR=1 FL=1
MDFTIEFIIYPGILLGFRTYRGEDGDFHTLYIPFISISIFFK